MNKNIKFIWDFRGPDAKKIAEHHCIHLNDYINREKLNLQIVGVEQLNDSHHIAYLVVEENNMQKHRDALKPHRGQIYQD